MQTDSYERSKEALADSENPEGPTFRHDGSITGEVLLELEKAKIYAMLALVEQLNGIRQEAEKMNRLNMGVAGFRGR